MKIIAFSKWLQSVSLPEAARMLKEAGFDGVDLPVRPGSPINHENARTELPKAQRIFEDWGLSIERIVSGIMGPEPGLESLLATFREVGVTKIRLMGTSFVGKDNIREFLDYRRRQLAELEPILERFGVSGALQNHEGPYVECNVGLCLYVLEGRNPKWLGIQLDPGHLSLSGEPPLTAIDLCGPYLHSVNFKAPRREPVMNLNTGMLSWVTTWVPLKDGMVDWYAVLRKLKDVNYSDPISIHCEYRSPYYMIEKDIEAVNKLVAQDVKFVRDLLKKLDM